MTATEQAQPLVIQEITALRDAERGLAVPFQLSLDGFEPLVVEQVLRHLPQRRISFKTTIGGTPALVKLFFRQKDHQRERAGLEALHRAGIPSPPMLCHFLDRDQHIYLLATEFLREEKGLEKRCYSEDEQRVRHWLQEALRLIGQMHRAGFMQEDIHLDNFLVVAPSQSLYIVDGGGIAIHSPLSPEQRLNNLALFFAQLITDFDQLIPDLLPAYGADAPSPEKLQPAVCALREKRIQRYLDKTLRTCSEFIAAQDWDKFTVIRRDQESGEVKKLITEPEVAFGGSRMLKAGNSSTVVRVDGQTGSRVIKRYNIKDWKHALSRGWRPSRAWVSWRNGHRLRMLGIHTPRPLALRENRSGPLRHEAYLITEFRAGEHLQAWLLRHSGKPVPGWLDEEIRRLFAVLWQSQVSHGDMKATNLLVSDEKLVLLDLDAMTYHRNPTSFRKAFRQDVERFLANWQGETLKHFNALLKRYQT